MTLRSIILSCTLLLLPSAGAAAQDLAKPTGPVLLSVSGNITRTNAPGRADFDRAMLLKLGVDTVTTSTQWTKGTPRFSGVKASKILNLVGAKGTTVRAVALNDYEVSIPISDFRRYPVILAMRMDGKELTRRGKGPLWIVYPRDDHAELRKRELASRWIWQLRKLVVE